MLTLTDRTMIAINHFMNSEWGMCLEGSWLCDVLEVTWRHLADNKQEREEREGQRRLADMIARYRRQRAETNHITPRELVVLLALFCVWVGTLCGVLRILRAWQEYTLTRGQVLWLIYVGAVSLTILAYTLMLKARRERRRR
jgi:hypothetical protein